MDLGCGMLSRHPILSLGTFSRPMGAMVGLYKVRETPTKNTLGTPNVKSRCHSESRFELEWEGMRLALRSGSMAVLTGYLVLAHGRSCNVTVSTRGRR